MIALACGDALGAAVKGMSRAQIAQAFPSGLERFRPGHAQSRMPGHPPGLPTDETELTLGLAEAYFLESGMLRIPTLIRCWVRWFENGPYQELDPEPTCHQALMKLANGVSFLKSALPSPSAGAAMRAAPIGMIFAFEADARLSDSLLQTSLTHHHPEAEAAALAMAEAVAFLLRTHQRPFSRERFLETLYDAIAPHAPSLASALDYLPENPKDPSSHVLELLPAALSIFLRHHDDLPRALATAASAGGPTDTLASMVGALCGAYLGLEAVPSLWRQKLKIRDRLERAAYGLNILGNARWTYLNEITR